MGLHLLMPVEKLTLSIDFHVELKMKINTNFTFSVNINHAKRHSCYYAHAQTLSYSKAVFANNTSEISKGLPNNIPKHLKKFKECQLPTHLEYPMMTLTPAEGPACFAARSSYWCLSFQVTPSCQLQGTSENAHRHDFAEDRRVCKATSRAQDTSSG